MPNPSRVTIMVAHGSRNPDAQSAHEDLVERVAASSGQPVAAAYLEIAEPSIPDAIDASVADGATDVRLLPCFLHPGNHVQVDLPRIVEEARQRHSGARFEVLDHLGADPGLTELLARTVSGH